MFNKALLRREKHTVEGSVVEYAGKAEALVTVVAYHYVDGAVEVSLEKGYAREIGNECPVDDWAFSGRCQSVFRMSGKDTDQTSMIRLSNCEFEYHWQLVAPPSVTLLPARGWKHSEVARTSGSFAPARTCQLEA